MDKHLHFQRGVFTDMTDLGGGELPGQHHPGKAQLLTEPCALEVVDAHLGGSMHRQGGSTLPHHPGHCQILGEHRVHTGFGSGTDGLHRLIDLVLKHDDVDGLVDLYAPQMTVFHCPAEFLGVKMQQHSIYGNSRVGVFRISDFYRTLIGLPRAPETNEEWLYTPEYALANASNGAVFYDGEGAFSAVREALCAYYPEDVRRKKLAAVLCFLAQSGQYNFTRCLRHGEPGAAALARGEFVGHALHLLFLLARRYSPFYKWQFRAARETGMLPGVPDRLERLLQTPADERAGEEMERLADVFLAELERQGILQKRAGETYLEPYALAVQDTIGDRALRAMHVMEGV